MGICDIYLDDIDEAHVQGLWMMSLAAPSVIWLKNNYSTSSFNMSWRTAVMKSIANIEDAVLTLYYGNWMWNTPYRIPYYLRNCISADIDMDTILNTLLTATPYQIQYFIGLVDAYRQSLWNKPFNSEFFAALARGFEGWE